MTVATTDSIPWPGSPTTLSLPWGAWGSAAGTVTPPCEAPMVPTVASFLLTVADTAAGGTVTPPVAIMGLVVTPHMGGRVGPTRHTRVTSLCRCCAVIASSTPCGIVCLPSNTSYNLLLLLAMVHDR